MARTLLLFWVGGRLPRRCGLRLRLLLLGLLWRRRLWRRRVGRLLWHVRVSGVGRRRCRCHRLLLLPWVEAIVLLLATAFRGLLTIAASMSIVPLGRRHVIWGAAVVLGGAAAVPVPAAVGVVGLHRR